MNKKNSKISCRIKCQSYSDTPRNTTILVLIYAGLFLFAIVVPWFSDIENAPLLLNYISTVVIALSTLLLVPDTIENRRKETNDEARTFIMKYSEIMGNASNIKASLYWFEKNKDADIQLYDNLMFTEFALCDKETRNRIIALLKASYKRSDYAEENTDSV